MNMIGVMGCTPRLPENFPVEFPENAGNMIHANAPFEMFGNCVFIRDDLRRYGETNFATLVNDHCSHLIVTLANTLRIGAEDGTKYTRQLQFLRQIKRPIVIFGLGVQSKNYDLDSATLPAEAVEWLRFLGERCVTVGVRGEYTKAVIERLSGIRNVVVVGCPSFFSRPAALAALRKYERRGRPSYAGTHFDDPVELSMLGEAIRSDTFLVEPVNRFSHTYYAHVSRGGAPEEHLPYFVRKLMKSHPQLSPIEIARYFRANYRLFRSTEAWYEFNSELVSFTYGTRFHVNMASILSGRPALWVTHDSRTQELVKQLHLPSLPLDEAAALPVAEIESRLQLTEFFDHLDGHFRRFNEYLVTNGLPAIKYNF